MSARPQLDELSLTLAAMVDEGELELAPDGRYRITPLGRRRALDAAAARCPACGDPAGVRCCEFGADR